MKIEEQNTYDKYLSLLYSRNIQKRAARSMMIVKMQQDNIIQDGIDFYINARFDDEVETTVVTEEATTEYVDDDEGLEDGLDAILLTSSLIEQEIIAEELSQDDYYSNDNY